MSSLFYAQRAAFHCLGTRLREATRQLGWYLSSYTAVTKWEISRCRAEWFMKWTREVTATDHVLFGVLVQARGVSAGLLLVGWRG